MSIVNIIPNDKIIEEFADFLLNAITEGAEIDIRDESHIIELFNAYVKEYTKP